MPVHGVPLWIVLGDAFRDHVIHQHMFPIVFVRMIETNHVVVAVFGFNTIPNHHLTIDGMPYEYVLDRTVFAR